MRQYDSEDDKRDKEKFDPRLYLVLFVETATAYDNEKAEQIFPEEVVRK
jgi:hypothetical protein